MFRSFSGVKEEEIERYLLYLKKEIDLVCNLLKDAKKEIDFMYWGGGSPTYLNSRQISDIYKYITNKFKFSEHTEISVEIDCRTIDEEKLRTLKQLGVNRLSFGIQTFDENILKIVNRYEETKRRIDLIEYAKKIGFSNFNIDIIYGLPLQTLEILDHTLDKVLDLETPHLTYYSAVIVPILFPNQEVIKDLEYPDEGMKVQMAELIQERCKHAGYSPIAHEYFVKDESYRSWFYTSMSRTERWLLGLGVIAGGTINNIIYGNVKTLEDYYQHIDAGNLPYRFTYKSSSDDLIRNYVINSIYVNGKIEKSEINKKFCINFDKYFAEERSELDSLEENGLITQNKDSICLTKKGRIFTSAFCDVFGLFSLFFSK